MKIRPEQEVAIRGMIRKAVALDPRIEIRGSSATAFRIIPRISIRGLQGVIEHNTKRSISDKYVMRLLGKIRREAIVQTDRAQLSARVAEVKGRSEALTKHLLRIAYWTPKVRYEYGIKEPKASERISAIKTIAQMDLALLNAEVMVGTFEDRRAAITEMLQTGLLPQEVQEQIAGVFRNWKAPLSVSSELISLTPMVIKSS